MLSFFMYEPKTFTFEIPIRPKAVQSTRFNGRYSYVDPKVKKWKEQLASFIRFKKPEIPSKMPFEVVEAVYTFKLPKSISKKAMKKIQEAWDKGEDVAYVSTPDLSDNINKGVADVLTAEGIWEDDKHLWRVAKDAVIKKVYGLHDSIKITIRETPDVLLSNGKTALEEYGV